MACRVTPEEYMSRLLMREQLHDGEDQEDDDEPRRDGALVGEGRRRPPGLGPDVHDERADRPPRGS